MVVESVEEGEIDKLEEKREIWKPGEPVESSQVEMESTSGQKGSVWVFPWRYTQ